MNHSTQLGKSIANQWFEQGNMLAYSPQLKNITADPEKGKVKTVNIWNRTIQYPDQSPETVVSFLPGFPIGSVEWIKINALLEKQFPVNRLFIDYVGQGDSDKPADYPYSTFERADLVEAIWKAKNIRETFVVTFDYSSLVLLEILARQIDRVKNGELPFTKITKVLMINGGYFTDGHSHPIMSTPLLTTQFGKYTALLSAKSKWAFNAMTRNMWAKAYPMPVEDTDTAFDAITRNNGSHFLHHAAGFVYEHQANGDRMDLSRIFNAVQNETAFFITGSDEDPFEPKQLVLAKERLGAKGVETNFVKGGHMVVTENPQLIVDQVIRIAGI